MRKKKRRPSGRELTIPRKPPWFSTSENFTMPFNNEISVEEVSMVLAAYLVIWSLQIVRKKRDESSHKRVFSDREGTEEEGGIVVIARFVSY